MGRPRLASGIKHAMTMQAPEHLLYDGEWMLLSSCPLEAYFSRVGKLPTFEFTTALGRGYVGYWEIKGCRLYLTGIWARLMDGSDFNLARCFPDRPDVSKVFAEWYSGSLCCSRGRLLERSRIGYVHIYEEDVFFEIREGMVTGIWRRNNRKRSESKPTSKTATVVRIDRGRARNA